MASSDVSSVTNYFSTAHEGFSTTITSQVLASATTVPLASVSGLTNGDIFVGIIEPGETKEQTFTGTVDTSGTQITGVVWTRGTDVDHASGVTVVDYVTGTGHNMTTTGLLVDHTQTGKHVPSAIYDPNNTTLETLKFSGVSSAINEVTVKNAAVGDPVEVQATGGDTDIDLALTPKGDGVVKADGKEISGDSSSYFQIGGILVQFGVKSVANGGTTEVTFPKAYSSAPIVSATSTYINATAANAEAATTTKVDLEHDGSASQNINWIAIGAA